MARSSLALLFVLALAAFTARTWALSSERLQAKWDEVGYLSLTRDYVREGGVLATVRCHLEQRCQETNRHPLYQLMLVPLVDDGPESFARGKLLTWATGVLLIGVVGLLATRAFDARVGAASAVMLSLSPILADTAAEIRHDLLFTALAAAAVFLCASGFDRRRWLAAGLLAGLAYLTKGSGHLVLAVALATALLRYRAAVVRQPIVYLAVLGFVAGAWWLLFRNVTVFGSPFFNFNNRAAWLDQWGDVWELQRSPEWSRVGLGWFVERHGVFGLVSRLVQGAGITFGLFIYASSVGFAGVPVQPSEVLANLHLLALPIVSGLAVVALGGWGLVMRWRAGGQARVLVETVVIATLLFWAALSVGALGGHDNPRYLLLITACWLPFAGYALIHGVVPRLAARTSRPDAAILRGLASAAVVALGVQLAWYRTGLASDPRTHWKVPESWAKTSRWLSTRLQPGEKFAINYHSLYSTWDLPRPDTDARWIYDYSANAATMARFLAADRVRTILVDAQDQDYPHAQRTSAERDAEGPLTFDGWPRCWTDGGHPSRFLAYCRPEPPS